MPGPSDPSSYGFFGQGYWGRKVFWEKIPGQHRQLDVEGHLESQMKAWGDECESFLQQIGALPRQREPYEVRARAGEEEWFYFTEAFNYEDPFWGQVVRLVGEKVYGDMPNHDEDDIPTSDEDELEEWWGWWPYAPISKVARWWEATWDQVPYKVARVRTRSFDWPETPYDSDNSQANEVWVAGGDLRIFFDYFTDGVVWRTDWTNIGEGDASATPDAEFPYTPVRIEFNTTGGSPWLTADAKFRVRLDLSVGGVDFDLYDVPDGVATETGNLYPESGTPGQIDTTTSYGTINYQTGQIAIDLTAAGDVSISDSDIRAKWNVRGYYLPFYPPRIIDYLARDFGFDNDKNDPEAVQRSTIANITKYHGLKSTQDSYRIRGEISLFTVYARAMWAVCDSGLWGSLSSYHQFVYHGELYTDVDPRYIRFDDISGDQELWDPDTSMWATLMDNAVMYEDTSTDGYSIALAYGLDVTQGFYAFVAPPPHPSSATPRDPAGVVSATLLTDTEAASYGFVAGYRVVVRMMRCQEYAFNWIKGPFGLTEYDKAEGVPPVLDDSVFWIDDVYTPWTLTAAGPTTDEDVGEWTIIVGVGKDSSGNPYPGPTVGHADIIAVDQPGKEFTISGDHTATISPGDSVAVMRSTGNDQIYTVATVTLAGSDTEVVVNEVISSAVADGDMGWTDVAVRYYPEVDMGNCCFCRSYKMRVEIEPTAEAYDFYDTDEMLDAAISRMRNKIAPPRVGGATKFRSSIVPIHARVVDWAITKEWVLENVSGGNTIDENLVGEFLSDDLADISGVDIGSDTFTINGDHRSEVVAGDVFTIRGSTGNDGQYSAVGVTYDGSDTVIEVIGPIPDATVDGKLYTMPSKILMKVDQRGDMSLGQQQHMKLFNEAAISPPWESDTAYELGDYVYSSAGDRYECTTTGTSGGAEPTWDTVIGNTTNDGTVVWTRVVNLLPVWDVMDTTNVSDPDVWYNVVDGLDVTALIGNNSPVKIEALDTGGISYGDVRFTFTVSKYLR